MEDGGRWWKVRNKFLYGEVGSAVVAKRFSAWLWLHLEFPNLSRPALQPSETKDQKITSCPEQLHQKFTFQDALPRAQRHSLGVQADQKTSSRPSGSPLCLKSHSAGKALPNFPQSTGCSPAEPRASARQGMEPLGLWSPAGVHCPAPRSPCHSYVTRIASG